MKRVVRLTENDIHRMVMNVAKRYLNEHQDNLAVTNLIGKPDSASDYNVPDQIPSSVVNYNPRKKHTQMASDWRDIDIAYRDAVDPSYWDEYNDVNSFLLSDKINPNFGEGSIFPMWYDKAEAERDRQNAQNSLPEAVHRTIKRYLR